MALTVTYTTKGVSINNAYIKIMRHQFQSGVATKTASKFPGYVQVGIFANKTLADAPNASPIDSIVAQIPDVTKLPAGTNLMAQLYSYLKTVSGFTGAVDA